MVKFTSCVSCTLYLSDALGKEAYCISVTHCFNSLPKDKILDLTESKAFVDDKLNIAKMRIPLYDRVENTVGKRRKYWLPAFSTFPTVFSKPSSLGSLKGVKKAII